MGPCPERLLPPAGTRVKTDRTHWHSRACAYAYHIDTFLGVCERCSEYQQRPRNLRRGGITQSARVAALPRCVAAGVSPENFCGMASDAASRMPHSAWQPSAA